MIGPWRTDAAPLVPGAPTLQADNVFPSGRQALTHVLRVAGLSRKDRVAVPEWSSACVLGAVSAYATPLLITDPMTATNAPAAVLVYDQWGWACPQRLAAVAERWPRALVIHDTVDTSDLSREALAAPPSIARARVWSLSKVLGLRGGGVACFDGELVGFSPDAAHRALRDALEGQADAVDIAKSHVRWLPSALEGALAGTDLFASYASERTRRRVNLDAVLATRLADDWPDWMKQQGAAAGGPGLCPLMRARPAAALEALRGRLAAELQLSLPAYHFDFSSRPFEPSFERCLALPLHGQVHPEIIGKVVELVTDFEDRHALRTA